MALVRVACSMTSKALAFGRSQVITTARVGSRRTTQRFVVITRSGHGNRRMHTATNPMPHLRAGTSRQPHDREHRLAPAQMRLRLQPTRSRPASVNVTARPNTRRPYGRTCHATAPPSCRKCEMALSGVASAARAADMSKGARRRASPDQPSTDSRSGDLRASGSRPASSSPPSASGGRALPRGPCLARR